MAHQKGSTVALLLGFESAYKTVAVDGFTMPFNTFGIRGERTLNVAQTITGTRNPVKPFAGNKNVAGPIVIPADSNGFWYWAKAMFGVPTQSLGPPYEYEFKIGSSMPSISLEAAYTDLATAKYNRFLGCKVNQMSMVFGGDGELVANLDILGASQSIESSAFDATPTAITLARVENFQAALTEGGGALSNAREVSLNINFGLDPDQFVIGGSGVRGSLPEQIVAVTGRLTTLFEDSSLLDKALAGTESSLKITVTASANSILEFELQEIQYEQNSPEVPGPQGLLVELNFQGFYDNGSEASAAVCRITNQTDHGL